MKSFITIPLLAALASAATVPTKSLTRRADSCEQYATVTQGNYIIYNNLWGKDNADSGKQCTGLDSINDGTVAWHTSWTWTGGAGQVKSFANAAYQFTAKTLSSVSNMDSVWKWSYTGSDLVVDVAYDMFLSSTADGDAEYEIMVWLSAKGGAGPISSTGSAVATTTIAGVTFDLYSGPNGAMTVYSFKAQSETESFSGDLLDFFKYLENNQGLKSSLYLTDVQAGTEPFSGTDAKFVTSEYSVTVA